MNDVWVMMLPWCFLKWTRVIKLVDRFRKLAWCFRVFRALFEVSEWWMNGDPLFQCATNQSTHSIPTATPPLQNFYYLHDSKGTFRRSDIWKSAGIPLKRFSLTVCGRRVNNILRVGRSRSLSWIGINHCAIKLRVFKKQTKTVRSSDKV